MQLYFVIYIFCEKWFKIYTTKLYGVKANKYMPLKIMKLSAKIVKEAKEEKDHTYCL